MITTLKGWAVIALSQYVALSSTGKGILFLVLMFHLDLVTGTYAAWYEAKQKAEKPKVYFIESAKLRKSVMKAVWYLFLIVGTWVLEHLYFDNAVGLPGSSKELTAHQVAIGICIAIEFWSNLENFKRCGFDIVAKIKGIALKIWSIIKVVKDGEKE